MDKNEIVEKWFREGVVQSIVKKASNGKKDAKYDDLISIVYLYLLEKPEELIQQLYQNGQYRYFIARMVMLQLTSPRSNHYYTIRRFSALSSEYDVNKPDNSDEEERKELEEVIELLPEDDKEWLKLYDYYNSKKEVVEHTGKSFFIVNNRIKKAINKAREILRKDN
ncbi:MAG: sigma-70 family RNA polymerase sigma factor [Methanobrevibacter sp.]|nr:sigma-70 family RNA polymerase sigma factor [Bacteroidales bacterium]MBO7732282.1 sigma-70 family RNA polymerase sigma factor [Methanobrevibacter sp.]